VSCLDYDKLQQAQQLQCCCVCGLHWCMLLLISLVSALCFMPRLSCQALCHMLCDSVQVE
jgi:hypothetical protein